MFHAAFAIVAFGDLFNANELEVDVGQLVDRDVGVGNVLFTMQTTLGLFKALKISLIKFEELIRPCGSYNHGPCETH